MSKEVSYNPKVSMDPAVHYTTQAAAYDRLIIGKPLTDADIERYELLRQRHQVPGEATKSPNKRTNRAARRKSKQLAYELLGLDSGEVTINLDELTT